MLDYARLALSRMNKWNKRFDVSDELNILAGEHHIKALAISEGWCGDAAQNLPALEKITAANGIEMRVVLRDDNLELMDRYLTNGGRSIPIVIFFDGKTGEEKAVWGPRPVPAQEILKIHKAAPSFDSHQFHVELHQWYAVDKQKTLSAEIKNILEELN
jgi:hypothetical protein